ncbi:hypothetical protein IW146_005952 [Coemansia sp. RSA 922]|nr:hypothetical protein H4S03_004197 [Coemansia sp. S3946]KAJ2067963.1 hypothetical protein GGI08_001121 [Coemansia sp. S2]KAJ2110336.1 hypothetical protein IW146_005952 [Coemansia sp. RSA 922]KAJ2342343.1 hypothetical protein GGH92_005417 [Coemansia sp. RSA 2673]
MYIGGTVNLYDRDSGCLDTMYEKRMRKMSSNIRSGPDWLAGLNNQAVCAVWAVEANAQGLTDVEFRYVLDELAYYSSLHSPGSNLRLSAADGVWLSDSLIDAETTQKLKDYVAILENVPDRQIDWYPKGQSCVRLLVDPSLYPLIYRRSKLLFRTGTPSQTEFPGSLYNWHKALNRTGEIDTHCYIPYPYEGVSDQDSDEEQVNGRYVNRYDEYASDEFSWLPSEFRVDDNGAVTIESYINNLHPVRHAALYPVIASVFSKFLPLLEHVIADLVWPCQRRVRPDMDKCYRSYEPMPNTHRDYEGWKERAEFVHPQPEPFVAPKRPANPCKLRGGRLQAIVNMSNIELTPDNPVFSGEDWSVAGLDNERIIATGVFFYDVANIADSSLGLRETIGDNPHGVKTHSAGAGLMLYGIDESLRYRGVHLPQELGRVDIKDGRCLVFPNTYQYQMPEFKLEDATKLGHCKMLTFYFVDPRTRIPSTEIVPPQQKDWWIEEVLAFEPFRSLPQLIVDGIMDKIDYPITLKEAKKIRLEMAEEAKDINERISSILFDPCFTFY